MLNILLILLGKSFSKLSNVLNLGAGATWPGHIALKFNPNFIRSTIGGSTKIVLIAGTNGKTTTSTLISEILKSNGSSVVHNKSGANQLNGIASAIITGTKLFDNKLSSNYLILEVDENVLPLALRELTPDYIVCLNLFRDQLDRYGEIDSIIKKWKGSFEKLDKQTTLILNADDPQIAFLGKDLKSKVLYFGLNENEQDIIEHGADSTYCPSCFNDLNHLSVTFSHLGNWECPNCGEKRPKLNVSTASFYPLLGTYNKYNTLAAALFAKNEKINASVVEKTFKNFKPAFGRQEEIAIDGKKVKIFLSKNPTSFNESLSTINSLNPKNLLIILNDRIPDGLDVSWIWDVKTDSLSKIPNISVSGDRTYDMGLRLKYSENGQWSMVNSKFKIQEDLKAAIKTALNKTPQGQTLYILPTYSAMLEVRKILKGRKIL